RRAGQRGWRGRWRTRGRSHPVGLDAVLPDPAAEPDPVYRFHHRPGGSSDRPAWSGAMRWWLAGIAAVAVAAALPLFLDPMGYPIRVLTLALLFAALGQAWNIVGGLANQISLGHAAFFGIGAYTSTLLLIHFGTSPWLGMIAGAALAALAAFLLSFPTMRLSGHYFALATLAFSEVLRVIATSWTEVTCGPVGLSVPFSPDSFAQLQFKSTLPYYYIILGALVLVSAVFLLIRHSAL